MAVNGAPDLGYGAPPPAGYGVPPPAAYGAPPPAAHGGGKTNGSEPTPSNNLYITHLPPGMTEQSLKDIFRAYGTVLSAKVLQADGRTKDGRGESVALVQMADTEQASWIVEKLNGNIPTGLTEAIQVKFANNRKGERKGNEGKGGGKGDDGGKRGKGYDGSASEFGVAASGSSAGAGSRWSPYAAPSPGQAAPGALADGVAGDDAWRSAGGEDPSNLYVKGLPRDADELYIYRIFAPLGGIESVKVIAQDWGTIAFVKFMLEEEAKVAIAQLSGRAVQDGSMLTVSVKTAKKREVAGAAQQSVLPTRDPAIAGLPALEAPPAMASSLGQPDQQVAAEMTLLPEMAVVPPPDMMAPLQAPAIVQEQSPEMPVLAAPIE